MLGNPCLGRGFSCLNTTISTRDPIQYLTPFPLSLLAAADLKRYLLANKPQLIPLMAK